MIAAELHLDLHSDPAAIAPARRTVEEFAARHDFGERAVADIGLCLNEALANIIRHAYEGRTDRPIALHCHAGDDALTVILRDWGNGRLPDLRRQPPDPTALHPGGLGLPCLKQLLDSLEFLPQPDGMLLKMIRRRR